SFHLLSAPRIVSTAGILAPPLAHVPAVARPVAEFAEPGRFRIRGDGAVLVDGDFRLPDATSASGDVIARGNIRIERNSRLLGSLHSDGALIIGDGAIIEGSVYCEGDLSVGASATIAEHAVTAGSAI